jgi:protein SCO1
MKQMLLKAIVCVVVLFCQHAAAHDAARHHSSAGIVSMQVPDVPVTDQNGQIHNLASGIMGKKTVVLDFIFTGCSTTCSVVTAKLRRVQEAVKAGQNGEVTFVSITVDPDNDTPAILKDYASRYEPLPGWWFLRAGKADLDRLLRAAGATPGSPAQHLSQVFIGNATTGNWTRVDASSDAETLQKLVEAERAGPSQDRSVYFTNLPLVDQDGRAVRFYSDMLKGKIVLITSLFTTCHDVCPMMADNIQRAVDQLPVSEARRLQIIAITTDPAHDTPSKLKEFADAHALKSWRLLTGKKENTDWVLYKLGLYNEQPQDHSTLLLLGNDRTGHWQKSLAMSDPSQIALILRDFMREAQANAR